jgi:hypothetical protein
MYSAKSPRRPWRGSSPWDWFPDRMTRIGIGRKYRQSGRPTASGNDRVFIRKVRVKQRRLDRHLSNPFAAEWQA